MANIFPRNNVKQEIMIIIKKKKIKFSFDVYFKKRTHIEIKHKQVFSLFHTYLTFTTEDSRVVNDSYTQRTSVIKQGKINQA